MRMTLDELINAMEPQARKDKALSGRWMISAKPDCCRRIRDGVKMAATHPTCIVSYKAASEKADPPAKGRVRLFAELRRGSW